MFDRSTRGAELTEHGRVCVELARRIITDVDNLHTIAQNVSYGLHGRITVGFCTSLMLGNLKLTFSSMGKKPAPMICCTACIWERLTSQLP